MSSVSDAEFVGLQSIVRGRYSLEQRIGRGGMGVVFLARDIALGRPVAIKVLSLALAADPRSRDRFLREARTAARLSHPHVVPIYSVEDHDDIVFFVMAYVDAETLSERVTRGGPLAPNDATRIMQEVAWALAYAHRLGVVHRDIKPENILLEHGSGKAMVVDFGIARVADHSSTTRTGELLGTAAYMSPEQISGVEIDGRSDIYSLGVTTFFALAGRTPFAGAGIGVLNQHVSQPAPPIASVRSDVPRSLAEAVDRCLAKDPGARFASGEELADTLGATGGQVELPMVLRRFARGVRAMGHELTAQIALVATLAIAMIEARTTRSAALTALPVVVIAGVGMMFALLAARFARVVQRARDILAAGLRFEDAQAVLPGGRFSDVRGAIARRPSTTASQILVATVCGVAALLWYYLFQQAVMGPQTQTSYASIGLLLAMPLFATRWIVSRLLLRPDAVGPWNGLWRGVLGRWVFDLAAIRLSRAHAAASVRPPEALIASAVQSLLHDLPQELRARLGDVTEAIEALKKGVTADRDRMRSVDDSIREACLPDASRPELLERRRAMVAELSTLRAELDARAAQKVAALENIRLDLLRFRCGLGSFEELLGRLDDKRVDLSVAVSLTLSAANVSKSSGTSRHRV
jgi:hypothetical protein